MGVFQTLLPGNTGQGAKAASARVVAETASDLAETFPKVS
jgi:hypothetical protein